MRQQPMNGLWRAVVSWVLEHGQPAGAGAAAAMVDHPIPDAALPQIVVVVDAGRRTAVRMKARLIAFGLPISSGFADISTAAAPAT